MEQSHVIIFDGVCNFCNGAINFIIKHDANSVFVFTPMQSDLAKELLQQHKIDNVGIDTFLLIKSSKTFIWTNAALEITKDLNGFWYLLNALKVVPRPIRDYLYRIFARNRYKLFGRSDYCMKPTENLKSRFIGIETS